jgi:uncharacterized membrane protein YoaK (UPF0700 family)
VRPATLRDLLLVGLTFASGAIDAVSFIALGKIFTAFMTGNLVFLGLEAAGAGESDTVRAMVALVTFTVGVFAASRVIGDSRSPSTALWPRRVSAALGLAMVLEAAFLALWASVSGEPGTASGLVLTALMATAMGLQSGAMLSLDIKGVFTTAATATVMFLSRDSARPSRSTGAERARLAGVIAALIAGAAAGGLLLVHARPYAPALPLVVTALVTAVARSTSPGRGRSGIPIGDAWRPITGAARVPDAGGR